MGNGKAFLVGFFCGVLFLSFTIACFLMPGEVTFVIISLLALVIILLVTNPKERELDLTKLPDGTKINLR